MWEVDKWEATPTADPAIVSTSLNTLELLHRCDVRSEDRVLPITSLDISLLGYNGRQVAGQ